MGQRRAVPAEAGDDESSRRGPPSAERGCMSELSHTGSINGAAQLTCGLASDRKGSALHVTEVIGLSLIYHATKCHPRLNYYYSDLCQTYDQLPLSDNFYIY